MVLCAAMCLDCDCLEVSIGLFARYLAASLNASRHQRLHSWTFHSNGSHPFSYGQHLSGELGIVITRADAVRH